MSNTNPSHNIDPADPKVFKRSPFPAISKFFSLTSQAPPQSKTSSQNRPSETQSGVNLSIIQPGDTYSSSTQPGDTIPSITHHGDADTRPLYVLVENELDFDNVHTYQDRMWYTGTPSKPPEGPDSLVFKEREIRYRSIWKPVQKGEEVDSEDITKRCDESEVQTLIPINLKYGSKYTWKGTYGGTPIETRGEFRYDLSRAKDSERPFAILRPKEEKEEKEEEEEERGGARREVYY